MPDDDWLTAAEETRREAGDGDPRDDWLGTTAELDWFAEGEEGREAPRRRGLPGRGAGRGPGVALDPEVRRRRLVAAGVLTAVIVIAVVLLLIAFGGGSGKGLTPTTPIQTVPLNTTPAKTVSPPGKKTSTSTKTLEVVVPASGKITLGDTGAGVKTLQKALVKLGASLTTDGNFGPATEQAVSAFQTAHGLAADGVVGAKTAQALNSAVAAAG